MQEVSKYFDRNYSWKSSWHAYLVTRKVFFCSATRTYSITKSHLYRQEFSKYFDRNYGWICRWPRLFGDKKCIFFCSATRTSSITKSHLVPYIFIGRSLPKQVFYCRITDYCVVMSNFFFAHGTYLLTLELLLNAYRACCLGLGSFYSYA